MGEDASQIRREIEATRARMGDTVEAIGYKADVPSRIRDNVNERIASVKETIDGTFGQAKQTISEKAQGLGDGAGDGLDRASDAARGTVSLAVQNPLGLALGALAVGFLAGLAIPVTDLEREQVGPMGEQLVRRTQSVAAEAVEAGQAVLNETLSTATESMKKHGEEIARHAVADTPLEA